MKQNAQVRTPLLTVIMAAVASVGFASAATAAGVGGGVNTKVGAGVQVAPPEAQAGGSADAHMSPTGSENSNPQWQGAATQGADRAAARMGTNVDALEPSTAAELEAAGQASAKAKRPMR
jgi:hypothetical protein